MSGFCDKPVQVAFLVPYVYFLLPFTVSEGRKHDAGMLADSGLLQDLQRFANSSAGNPFCLYGHPAYPHRIYLQTPFRNRALTAPMIAFNQSMSTVRESVEWLFNDIVNYFKFIWTLKRI